MEYFLFNTNKFEFPKETVNKVKDDTFTIKNDDFVTKIYFLKKGQKEEYKAYIIKKNLKNYLLIFSTKEVADAIMKDQQYENISLKKVDSVNIYEFIDLPNTKRVQISIEELDDDYVLVFKSKKLQKSKTKSKKLRKSKSKSKKLRKTR